MNVNKEIGVRKLLVSTARLGAIYDDFVKGIQRGILADGSVNDVAFDTRIERSSWIAVRILPTSHTNPIFVTVGGKPIRASRKSAEWCLKAVDQCWSQKSDKISAKERGEAEKAYERAREIYKRILAESDAN